MKNSGNISGRRSNVVTRLWQMLTGGFQKSARRRGKYHFRYITPF